MKYFLFLLAKASIEILSRFPSRILYFFSDLLSILMYYIVGYRKKTILKNLEIAYPNKTLKERNKICRSFYTHFTDLVFESIISFSISEKRLKQKYIYKNINIINDLAAEGKSIILIGSHHNNWELSFGLPLEANINCYGAYTKIANPYFEKYIKKSRKRFGYDGVPTYDFKVEIEKRFKNNIQSLYILLSDQSPQLSRTKHWSTFFNQFVPVHTGAELLAKRYDCAIVNINTTKIKRGVYEADFELITSNPKEFKDYEITEKYLKITEAHINKQPENYLWSHKRFKHVGKYEEWKNLD